MIPCADCFKYMQDKVMGHVNCVRSCSACYNFWKNEDVMVNIPDNDYPHKETLPPLKLSYNLLKEAATLTHNSLVDGS